jgi:hypothetical protein
MTKKQCIQKKEQLNDTKVCTFKAHNNSLPQTSTYYKMHINIHLLPNERLIIPTNIMQDHVIYKIEVSQKQ